MVNTHILIILITLIMVSHLKQQKAFFQQLLYLISLPFFFIFLFRIFLIISSHDRIEGLLICFILFYHRIDLLVNGHAFPGSEAMSPQNDFPALELGMLPLFKSGYLLSDYFIKLLDHALYFDLFGIRIVA